MVKKLFVLVGAPARTAQEIEINLQNTFEYLQWDVAQHFSIAEPSGRKTSLWDPAATLTATRNFFPDRQGRRTRRS
jgi:hypothetical protein